MTEKKKQVAVMLDMPVFTRLWAEAQAEGVSVAEVVRRIIDERIRGESARLGVPVVENAVRRVIKPHVDQLAGMLAHAGIAACTSAWLGRALVNLLTQVEPDEAWEQAVAQAKTGLRRSLKTVRRTRMNKTRTKAPLSQDQAQQAGQEGCCPRALHRLPAGGGKGPGARRPGR